MMNSKYISIGQGKTFDGRDKFAPASAYLIKGVEPSELGPETSIFRFLFPKPNYKNGKLYATVLHVDKYGDIILNISPNDIKNKKRIMVKTENGRKFELEIYNEFKSVKGIGAILGSFGYMEIVRNRGSAADELRLRSSDKLFIL